MVLEKYQAKRKFQKTPEPKGAGLKTGKNRFVVHKHFARSLHYDFRLELPENFSKGRVVLKSWAVPKGVPLKAGLKHLAVAVEDHPVDYLNFSGVIPKGQYGAGIVEIFDKGKFKIVALTPRSLKIELAGKKFKGNYVLFNFSGKSWFIFKVKKP